MDATQTVMREPATATRCRCCRTMRLLQQTHAGYQLDNTNRVPWRELSLHVARARAEKRARRSPIPRHMNVRRNDVTLAGFGTETWGRKSVTKLARQKGGIWHQRFSRLARSILSLRRHAVSAPHSDGIGACGAKTSLRLTRRLLDTISITVAVLTVVFLQPEVLRRPSDPVTRRCRSRRPRRVPQPNPAPHSTICGLACTQMPAPGSTAVRLHPLNMVSRGVPSG